MLDLPAMRRIQHGWIQNRFRAYNYSASIGLQITWSNANKKRMQDFASSFSLNSALSCVARRQLKRSRATFQLRYQQLDGVACQFGIFLLNCWCWVHDLIRTSFDSHRLQDDRILEQATVELPLLSVIGSFQVSQDRKL